MAEYQRQDLSEVESLLASRKQINEWLDKLEAAGSKTPPSVRDRVRSDYQARMAQVVNQIRGHTDVIANQLNGLRSQAEEFEGLRTEEQETLAEAELRYSVGEFSDAEWQRVERDASGKIKGLDEELDRLAGEIARLEEVLAQISPAPAAPSRRREPEPATAAGPEPSLTLIRDEPPAVVHHAEPPAAIPITPAPRQPAVASQPAAQAPAAEVPEAPRFVPRGGLKPRESGPTRTIPFPSNQPAHREPPAPPPGDELAFLKSVTLDGRAAGGTAAAPTATESKSGERTSPSVAKTLKCGECGALNRPTEWYCDRCGAELAAV